MVTHSPTNDRAAASSPVRDRILAAAADELARRGFAGARVDRIARMAGANKRMLYHYFGDKHGLRQAVLGQRLDEVRAAGTAHAPSLDRLTARLVLWTLLEEGAGALGAHGLDERMLATALVTALWPGEAQIGSRAPALKPRVRLKPGQS